jgi:glycosyltransferase involved in cell wall biosynthesis
LGDAARQRIKAHFDLDTIVKQYERYYDELATAAARAKG